MEFNAQQQYRPSSNRAHLLHETSPTPGSKMMYLYGTHSQQGQHPPQPVQQMARPSPPQTTWSVPQNHNPYHHMRQAIHERENSRHVLARTDIATTQSPVSSSAAFSNSIHGSSHITMTDYFPGVIDTSPWGQKVCEELESFPSLDPDVSDYGHGIISHDENTPIIDLRQYPGIGPQEQDGLNTFHQGNSARRLSESSFSMSSTGGVLEISSYEDNGPPEVVSYPSEYEAWKSAEHTTGQLLSPLSSPRRTQQEHIARGGSRSRASPAPHNNIRSSPYTMDSTRHKRWSTGHAPTSTPTCSRTFAQISDRFAPYGPRYNPHHSMPIYPSSSYNNYGQATQNVLYSHTSSLQSSNPTFFSNYEQPYHLEVPRPLPSQGLFRLLQSNADRHGGCSSHFTDLSDPPDLYSSLHEEPSNPPESDMNPSDPDLLPHEQDLRFNGDFYTPRWVRGHGNKREGWCGLCKPGRWLVLKNSAFWYDKSFTHGVSAATGAAFQGPQDTRRTEGNLDVWEGLCGSCGEWIALVSSKKKGTTWFRHAYKCHTHPKVKDGPKRRRETQAGRVRAASSTSATSCYPLKQENAQCLASHRHSTPTPITGSSSLRGFGIPEATTSRPLPTSTPDAKPQPHASSTFANSTAYSLSTPATPTMYSHRTPTQASFPGYSGEPTTKHGPVVGLFTTPLQSLQIISGNQPSCSHSLGHQVSEPELVGIPTTTTTLNSIASMI
ncbi:hypothetical protein BDU57DRAFT_527235 [Ampelomyces quisqualis]|uniref:Transcription regulator Rua1 C-terminal domain-containing protein n=1 Tax=Ampelomyces quisqualis TaxID=50730 RepID=A0A6A5QZ84_AMPQU|nr:hypothetical protein BDU57DRAFT_527235 [Ampelomyces quisqualis]